MHDLKQVSRCRNRIFDELQPISILGQPSGPNTGAMRLQSSCVSPKSRTRAASPSAAPAARPGAARVGRRTATTQARAGLTKLMGISRRVTPRDCRECLLGIGESPRNSSGRRGWGLGARSVNVPPKKLSRRNFLSPVLVSRCWERFGGGAHFPQ